MYYTTANTDAAPEAAYLSINISKERGHNKYCRIDMKVVHLHDVCECIVQIDKSINWWGCEIVLMYF